MKIIELLVLYAFRDEGFRCLVASFGRFFTILYTTLKYGAFRATVKASINCCKQWNLCKSSDFLCGCQYIFCARSFSTVFIMHQKPHNKNQNDPSFIFIDMFAIESWCASEKKSISILSKAISESAQVFLTLFDYLTANIRTVNYHFDNHRLPIESDRLPFSSELWIHVKAYSAYENMLGHSIELHFLSLVLHSKSITINQLHTQINPEVNIIRFESINIYIINYQFEMDGKFCVMLGVIDPSRKQTSEDCLFKWRFSPMSVCSLHVLFGIIECTFYQPKMWCIFYRQL